MSRGLGQIEREMLVHMFDRKHTVANFEKADRLESMHYQLSNMLIDWGSDPRPFEHKRTLQQQRAAHACRRLLRKGLVEGWHIPNCKTLGELGGPNPLDNTLVRMPGKWVLAYALTPAGEEVAAKLAPEINARKQREWEANGGGKDSTAAVS